MTSLPSPRSLFEGKRDLIQNAIGLMTPAQIDLVHTEIGAFCLEVLLDGTLPKVKAALAEDPPSARRQATAEAPVERLTAAQTAALVGRLRERLGDDGWTEARLRRVLVRLPRCGKTAAAVLAARPAYRLTFQVSQMIEDFLNDR